MNSDNYHKLAASFSKFNEAIIELYSDLMDLLPKEHRPRAASLLQGTLAYSSSLYKSMADILFEHRVK